MESFAHNQQIPIEWAEKGVRKEDYVLPYLRRAERQNRYGVYFNFQAMEQGWSFRPSKKPREGIRAEQMKKAPVLCHHRTRFKFYYFYLRDEVLGPIVLRMGTFVPFEASYYLNGHHYIENQLKKAGVKYRKLDNAFLWADDEQALQAAADSLSGELIRKRLNRTL